MANTTTDLYLKKLREKYKEKGATENEANVMASQNQAQQEAQNAQNLNGWQKFGLGVGQFADSVAKTFLDLGEGLVDAHAFAVGSVADWFDDDELVEKTKNFIKYDATEKVLDTIVGKDNRDYMKQQDVLPDVLDTIASGIGSSLGMGALSSIPYVGWALTGMAAGGASAEQELIQNPDIDITEAMGYGILNGSVEVASELLVGKALGLLGKGVNKVAGGSVVSETATRFGLGSSTGGNILTNLIKEFNEEGIEEVVSELVDPIARKLTIDKDKELSEIVGDDWINDIWTAYWQGGLSSVVMGGAGATVNTVRVGGVRNYNASLQVRQVAEINEQIKELERKNTNGKYDSRITALEAQKQNVIENFEKNFKEFAKEYKAYQEAFNNGGEFTKHQARKANIYEALQQENSRNIREELTTETALNSGAFTVTFNDTDENGNVKPSYAIKNMNFINYDGKKLSTKEWINTVLHEIGHINAKDFNFVDSILQDIDAQDLQKSINKYNELYRESYTEPEVRKSDYFKQLRKDGYDYPDAIKKAREMMIKEEIAMDRFASMFSNIDEFNRAIKGEKLSALKRIKERFSNAYHNVTEAQKPSNYNDILKALQKNIEQNTKTKINVDEETDIRYSTETTEQKTEPTKKSYSDESPLLESEVKRAEYFSKKVIPVAISKAKLNNRDDIVKELEAISKELTSSDIKKGRFNQLVDRIFALNKEADVQNEVQNRAVAVDGRVNQEIQGRDSQENKVLGESGANEGTSSTVESASKTESVRKGIKGDVRDTEQKVSSESVKGQESSTRSELGVADSSRRSVEEVRQTGKGLGVRGNIGWDSIQHTLLVYRQSGQSFRGTGRRTAIRQLGRMIKDNGLTIKKNVEENCCIETVDVSKLPETLQNEYKELSKIPNTNGKKLNIYFYVSEITDERNGFSSSDEDYVAIRLDSFAPNTSVHEISHILSKTKSNAYTVAKNAIDDYFNAPENAKEYNRYIKKIEKTYNTKYRNKYAQELFNQEKYGKLDELQKAEVDKNVKIANSVELFCAVIQGKYKISDDKFYTDVFNSYIDNINKEYGADLKPYVENVLEENEKRTTTKEINRKDYIPVGRIYVRESNVQKVIEYVNEYYDKLNAEFEAVQKDFTDKVENASSIMEANNELKKRKDELVNLLHYYSDISRIIMPIQSHYETSYNSSNLIARQKELKATYDSLKALTEKPLGEIVKLDNVKDLIASENNKEYNKTVAYIDERVKTLDINSKSGTYMKLENLKEEFKHNYDSATANNIFDTELTNKSINRIDSVILNYGKELDSAFEALMKADTEQLLYDELELVFKNAERGNYTYAPNVEKEKLLKIKEQLKPLFDEWYKANHDFTVKHKSIISKFTTTNESVRKPGEKAIHNLLNDVTNLMNQLIDIKTRMTNKAMELKGTDNFRSHPYRDTLGNLFISISNKLGSKNDTGAESWYGLRNQLEYYLGIYNNKKDYKALSEEFDKRYSEQNASVRKEIRQTLTDMERNIPNEVDDTIKSLEEYRDELKELVKQNTDLVDENKRLNERIEQLNEIIKKGKKAQKKIKLEAENRINVWKSRFLEANATIADLTKANKELREKYLDGKTVEESQEYIDLKGENERLGKEVSELKRKYAKEKEINKELKETVKQKEKEYKKKASEASQYAKKLGEARRKLALEKANGQSIIKLDNNFYSFINEFMDSFQNEVKKGADGNYFNVNTMKKLAIAFANNDSQMFADTLINELRAKGNDTMLMALEDGDYLYYEDNFVDLLRNAFDELNTYKDNDLTNVGKLIVRLENAKTDYKLLKEMYKTDLRVRDAANKIKSFTKFFNENTKATSSRLNGVDEAFRDSLINFVSELSKNSNLDSVENGTVRDNIIDFFDDLKSEYKFADKKVIEVNGVALDNGILEMVDYLKQMKNLSNEYKEDLKRTSEDALEKAETEKEIKKATPKNTEKISEYEAKLYKDILNGLRKFTDEVMHNRYWTVGNVTMKGVDFTNELVNSVAEYKRIIKQLKWNPFFKMYESPRNIFREISGYDNNSLVMEMYNELEMGTIKTMEAKMELAKPLKEFFNKNKGFEKEVQTDSKKYNHTINYGDNKSFTASTSMLIDFYEAMRNENNKQHIINDGFELGDTELISVTSGELEEIKNAIEKEFNLNDENSVYAQYVKLLDTMYEKAKDLKVETDIRSRGFTNIQEGFYYPTVVSDFNLDIDIANTAFQLGNTYGGANLGFTGERNFNKNLRSTRGGIRITNSYQKMLSHINGMASYSGIDTAILNFSKIYRYRVEGGISNGNIIRQLYGADYRNFDKYLGELFKDMRGTNNPMTGTDATINKIEKFVRSGVVTATLVNPKVIATQPASLLSAMKYLNPKHILSSLKEGFVLTKKYPPLPTSGAMRYFDQSALEAETGGIENKIQSFLGKGITAGDHFAINIEWAACCKQVGLLNYEKGTVEYKKALDEATELFNRVVFDTQPNNTALGKAEIMRSDNEIVKLLTMYRSQAMQNFNIAYDAINQLRTINKIIKAKGITGKQKVMMLAGPRKDLARALASLILEGALFTLIGQLFAHFVNNDWDSEDFWANASKDFAVSYFNDNVLGIMPVLNKLELDLEKGFSMDHITMGWLENAVTSIQGLVEKPNPKKFIQVFSYATGIPVATNYKYTKAIIQYLAPEFAYEFDAIYNGIDTTNKYGINYALEDKQYDKAYELYKKYTSYSVEFDMQTTKELFNLYKQGYTDVAVKKIPENISYNGETIKVDKAEFKDIYSKVAKRINSLTKSYVYSKLPTEKKAETLKYLLNTYYSIAKKKQTGQELSFIEKLLLNDVKLTPSQLLQILAIKDMESDENSTKKEKIQEYIDKLKTTKQEKYFLYMTTGYSLSDDQKKMVKGYLINKGLSWKKATAML